MIKITTFVVKKNKIYTVDMLKPLKKLIKQHRRQIINYLYAFVLLVMVLAQLFNFNEFLKLISNFQLPGGEVVGYFFGGLVVIFEVSSLPYLIDLKIPRLFKVFSKTFGLIIAFVWLLLAIWLMAINYDLADIGIFGGIVEFASGGQAIVFGTILCFLAVISAKPSTPKTK